MRPRDTLDLLLLAALWGGSFLFLRIAVPEFGPVVLIELRVLIASALLLGVLAASGGLAQLRRQPLALLVVGITNSALPFCLLAYTTLSVTAGFAAILNATSPMWTAVVAYLWLGTRLTAWRSFGLLLGFAGVVLLAWGKASFKGDGAGLAIVAGMVATLSYGVAANYTRQKLSAAPPLVIATGSMLSAALCLLPLAIGHWPAQPVSWRAWASVVALATGSTAFAYVLYFRLIARIGPAKAIAVTFLVPLFAIVWGWLFLGEPLSWQMAGAGSVILLGTAVSTGLLKLPWAATIGRTA